MIKYIHYTFFFLVITVALSSIPHFKIFAILSMFIAPIMGWTSGQRARIFYQSLKFEVRLLTKFLLLFYSVITLIVAILFMHFSQAIAVLFIMAVSGEIWVLIGFIIGLFPFRE